MAEDIHLFRQHDNLIPHQLQHIFRHLRMVRTGIPAPLGNMVLFDKQHRAVLFADGQKRILLISKGKRCPEYARILQIFQ